MQNPAVAVDHADQWRKRIRQPITVQHKNQRRRELDWNRSVARVEQWAKREIPVTVIVLANQQESYQSNEVIS